MKRHAGLQRRSTPSTFAAKGLALPLSEGILGLLGRRRERRRLREALSKDPGPADLKRTHRRAFFQGAEWMSSSKRSLHGVRRCARRCAWLLAPAAGPQSRRARRRRQVLALWWRNCTWAPNNYLNHLKSHLEWSQELSKQWRSEKTLIKHTLVEVSFMHL